MRSVLFLFAIVALTTALALREVPQKDLQFDFNFDDMMDYYKTIMAIVGKLKQLSEYSTLC